MERARTMEAEKAAAVLEKSLAGHRGDLTIADAAAKSGLALRDAELGLHHLSSEYNGRLSTTEKGELLFRFPRGFQKPFVERTGLKRFWDATVRAVKGTAKFVLRAWISIVLIGYVAVFLAILIGLMFANRGERSDSGGAAIGALFRVILEALYWTFHPFSPFNVTGTSIYDTSSRRRGRRRSRFADDDDFEEEEKPPFYERVNRFVFGPEEKKPDPRELQQRIVAQIRSHKGRIGIGDVLRITGLPREEADPLMARLMLDYEGDVSVSDDGGITYSFPALRRTAETAQLTPPPPVWTQKVEAPPITGNDVGSNVLVGFLNGFNLIASFIAIEVGLTVDKLIWLFEQSRSRIPIEPPDPSTPLVLGWIPFVMSMAIFALPIVRTILASRKATAAKEENARRALLRTVLDQTQSKNVVHEEKLKAAWKSVTGDEPSDAQLAKEVAALGGDLDTAQMNEGRAAYRFRDLEAEVKALEDERKQATDAEREVGAVVFRA
jgi:hypothetical protein